ncbi:histidine phosphatase family protein [uncultured Pontibacter sp.]|uniref:SixA phosphatase family protein n=1 Tax=uncultured Pontibacter sp. TaxID=453356 RepID=UPI0026395324|nr:phosphoglycerate mutase family protein [uncultured Pontibacter sp.]
MKQLTRLLSIFLFVTLASACSNTAEQENSDEIIQQNEELTTIYLVRHAEKDTTDASNEDPDLTEAGHARAEALRALLAEEEVHALYATKYVRTGQTLGPLSQERNIQVVQYEGHDFHGLKERLLREHRGQTVVVAGHSNTLLPIIEAFGAEKPLAEIPDSAYSYLFKLLVDSEDNAKLEVQTFGVGAAVPAK